MEIGDYGIYSRKIIFNLDKKRDFLKAVKTFTPKGLKKRRRKYNKKNRHLIQQSLTGILETHKKNLRNQEQIQKPKKEPEPETELKNPIKFNKKPDKTDLKIILDDKIISQFGTGGNLEVSCPFCQDIINFNYDNLEEKKKKATRICSCDAIVRISTRVFNKKIFSDFGIHERNYERFVQKIGNEVEDEFGNPIYTYAFRNNINY
ncbi:MAG: hypothetical protein ACTSWX_09115 [Promethearchaeota archaeon]